MNDALMACRQRLDKAVERSKAIAEEKDVARSRSRAKLKNVTLRRDVARLLSQPERPSYAQVAVALKVSRQRVYQIAAELRLTIGSR